MGIKGEKKKEGSAKKEIKKDVKVEPESEDMISSVKSRRLMTMQAKKEREEQDRQNKGKHLMYLEASHLGQYFY